MVPGTGGAGSHQEGENIDLSPEELTLKKGTPHKISQ